MIEKTLQNSKAIREETTCWNVGAIFIFQFFFLCLCVWGGALSDSLHWWYLWWFIKCNFLRILFYFHETRQVIICRKWWVLGWEKQTGESKSGKCQLQVRNRILWIYHGNRPGENPNENQLKVIKQISFLLHTPSSQSPITIPHTTLCCLLKMV